MIKEVDSFELYKGFIEEISAEPMFADPHYEFDHSNLYDALKKNNRKAYAVTEGGRIGGLFVWMIQPEEKYIEMLIGLSREETAIREMLAFIEVEYKGYQLDFVFNPRHALFCEILKEKQAKFDKEQQWMAWEKEVNLEFPHEIVLLTKEYEAQYMDKHNKDTYWTAEKVMAARERFHVLLAIEAGKVVGYLDVTHCYRKNEPYDLWVEDGYQDKGYAQSLLLEAIKMNKSNEMMVLVDIGNDAEIKILESIGFVPVIGTNSVYATYVTK